MHQHISRSLVCALTISLCLVMASTWARADWNEGDPFKMHYPQLPDLTPTGMDVLATRQPTGNFFKLLADDWRCTETGPVSDIHIWGSWLNDRLPGGSPQNVTFKLSIHSDIPVSQTGEFSRPGEELWKVILEPTLFTVRPYATGQESFYDPNLHEVIGQDHTIWQYNFTHFPIPPFIQERGKIYWLDVQALPAASDAFFGWKTTNPQDPRTPHFLDDAVFGDTDGFGGGLLVPPGWSPLVYPPGHPYANQSIDQAFVITPEPASLLTLAAGAMGLLSIRRRS